MPSDGESIVPPVYLKFPRVRMISVCPLNVFIHFTAVTAESLLTIHCMIIYPPTLTSYVLNGMVTTGRSVTKKSVLILSLWKKYFSLRLGIGTIAIK